MTDTAPQREYDPKLIRQHIDCVNQIDPAGYTPPTDIDYWMCQVDPDEVLDQDLLRQAVSEASR